MKTLKTKKGITPEQKLFKLIDHIGETLTGSLHIIDTSEQFPIQGEKNYRIYHSEGYCWDIKKEAVDEDEKSGHITYSYSFYEEWEGFKKCSCIEEVITRIALACDN